MHDDVIKWKHFLRNSPFVRKVHRSPGDSPHKGQWRGTFDVFFDLGLNKRCSKQSRCRWFETPSRSLWRHCNGLSHSCKADMLNSMWFDYVIWLHRAQHWRGWRLVASRHRANTWPKVDLSLMGPVSFTCEQFHEKYSGYQSVRSSEIENHTFKIIFLSSKVNELR